MWKMTCIERYLFHCSIVVNSRKLESKCSSLDLLNNLWYTHMLEFCATTEEKNEVSLICTDTAWLSRHYFIIPCVKKKKRLSIPICFFIWVILVGCTNCNYWLSLGRPVRCLFGKIGRETCFSLYTFEPLPIYVVLKNKIRFKKSFKPGCDKPFLMVEVWILHGIRCWRATVHGSTESERT